MIPILSVEVNTWFLIARRVLYLRRDTISATVRDWIDYAFNVTWIITRVVIQNWLLWRFCSLFYLRIIHGQTLLIPSLFVFTQMALNIMNVKWTYDLFKPMIQRNFFPENDNNKNDVMMKKSDNNKQHTL
jgi:hypothetical protein